MGFHSRREFMSTNLRDSRWLGHVTAFSATLVLGVAIAVAQNKVDQKQPIEKTTAAPAKTNGDKEKSAADKTARARGHALGMTVEAHGDDGITVSKVDEAGPAAKAGLKPKDRIVAVDNRTFKRPRQLEAYLASHGDGKSRSSSCGTVNRRPSRIRLHTAPGTVPGSGSISRKMRAHAAGSRTSARYIPAARRPAPDSTRATPSRRSMTRKSKPLQT